MSDMSNVLKIGIGAAIMIIGVVFLVNILAATDDGVDMTDSVYEDQYDSVQETSIISLGLIKILIPILGIVCIVVALMVMKKYL